MGGGEAARTGRKVSKYVSPDESLTLLVIHEGNDITIGFEGHPWHTHADVLAGMYGLPPEAAVARFLDALLGNEAVVAITTVVGRIEDVRVSDDPSKVDVHAPADEATVSRFWDGTPWTPPAP